MADIEYLNRFENKLQEALLRLCTSYHMLDGTLLASDDIDLHWKKLAPEYMADAVPQVREYPTVSVAWAAYLGMVEKAEYQAYYGEQGFDDMDEHIVRDILGLPLDGEEARNIEAMVRRCAQAAIDHIRHEGIEPQSEMAFHVFARATKAMYRIGAAMELKRLGYKFEKINLAEC